MARVTDRAWKTYKDNLNKLSQRSKDLIVAYMESHEITSQEDKDALIRYAYSVSTKYGEAAAEFACQMYDAEAELEGVTLDPAEPAQQRPGRGTPFFRSQHRRCYGDVQLPV